MKNTQISVFLENRTGQLCRMLGQLALGGVDLRAINIAEANDYGVVRMIADDFEKASGVLSSEGYVFSVNEVAAVEVPDRPGGLAELLEKLSLAQIDIEYMYSCFGGTDGKAIMVLKVTDPDAVAGLFD